VIIKPYFLKDVDRQAATVISHCHTYMIETFLMPRVQISISQGMKIYGFSKMMLQPTQIELA
jgi:hypothetical protein